MPVINQDVPFLPSQNKIQPPTKLLSQPDGGRDAYLWYITEDEYLRLNQVFGGRDFQELNMGGTKVFGLPLPCKGCGKYTEFIDWVWTALRRGVHTPEFMFNALKHGRQGAENMHDVYCSECGLLTAARSRNNAEGGAEAPRIEFAKPLDRSKYDLMPELLGLKPLLQGGKNTQETFVTWGKWWLDDTGSTAAYQARMEREQAEVDARAENKTVDKPDV